ncbi:MAG: hypothetical protein H6Q73_890 [Firmicutes bacterium]|nr:hypothetical protein [Bacillota bacterium]
MVVVRVAFPGVVYKEEYIKEESLYNCFSDIDLVPGNLVVCDIREREPRAGRVLSILNPEENSEPVNGWIIQKVDMVGYKKKRKEAEQTDLLDWL